MKRMIAASLKSILIWICIYFMIANCIVVWKWLTPPTITTNDTTTTTSMSSSSSSTTTIESLQQQQQEQEIQKFNDMINKFDKALHHSEQRLRSMEQQFHEYQQYIISTTTTTLSYNNNNIKLHDDNDNDNDDGIFVNVDDYMHTQKLFATTNISSSTLTSLTTTILTNEIVAIVIDELQQLIEHQQWDILHNIIIKNKNNDNSQDDDDDDDDTTPQCTNQQHNNKNNHQYVTKEQLQRRIEYIRDTILLSQQQEGQESKIVLPLSFDTSIHIIQQYLQTILSNEINLLRNNNNNNNNNAKQSNYDMEEIEVVDTDTNCLSESFIQEAINIWMNIGLETIYQQYCNTMPENKQNNNNIYYTIRQELLQSIQHYCHDNNIDCNHIRFDIPETTITTTSSNNQHHHHPIIQRIYNKKYIRQLIDLPSIYYLSIYIDIILERMTGMNDKLDDIIDQYIYNPILASNIQHDESTKSIMNYIIQHHQQHGTNTNTVLIGPIIVSYILNQLGNVPIPTNKIFQNE